MIQFGNDKIKEIYFGSEKIKEVYHGSDLVWSGENKSYLIRTNGVRVEFELENTPINTFSGQVSSNMNVNGTWIGRSEVRELYFGESYSAVTSLPSYFLYNFNSLQKVGLSILTNVSTIGAYAFSNFGVSYTSYIDVDLKALSNLSTVGNNFMSKAYVGRLTLGAIVPPSVSTRPVIYFNNSEISEIVVPCESVSAYKKASGWKIKEAIIKCEEIIDPQTSFVMFKNSDVNWVDGWNHGEGLWSNGDELVLTASNDKISAVMTDESFKITDYSKMRIKWSYSGVTAHANNILRIEFRNNPNTNFKNRIRYDVTTNSATETLTINLASITNANLWDVSENYKVLFFAFGYTSTPVQVNIEEIIFIE